MTMRQQYGNWTQVTGWGTALASVGDTGATTSGIIDNSTAKSYAAEFGFFWDKDSGTGTGTIELWLLALLSDGADQLEDAPPRGGTLIGVVSTAAEATQRSKKFRVNELPEKFAVYLLNNSGVGLATTSDVRYRFVDLYDA
jgi:hypothetical protein